MERLWQEKNNNKAWRVVNNRLPGKEQFSKINAFPTSIKYNHLGMNFSFLIFYVKL